ncbi:putative NBD/HSP70 family sugar kinase [Catenulispora sp. GP43]|uniref:hypothetical protein n=1 Tax=Catenulispora sp. GP43 TaxID=3156263 RepID=UPI003513775F
MRAAADAVALAVAELTQSSAARAFLDELAASIADAVLALSATFDPGHVFLSGEVCLAGGQRLAESVTAAVAPRSPVPIEVGIGSAGSDAVLAGALAVALDRARDDLFGPQWSAG